MFNWTSKWLFGNLPKLNEQDSHESNTLKEFVFAGTNFCDL